MPDPPESGQSVPDRKKLTMPEQVRYRTKLTQSGIFLVWYQTEIRDAGMPMPALVSSMPMPSYASFLVTEAVLLQTSMDVIIQCPLTISLDGHQYPLEKD